MNEITEKAINSVNGGLISFCRFITANDTGRTGSHQSGFYIPKDAYSLFFDSPGVRQTQIEKFVKIKWQDDFEKESRAIYYGKKTRNEYRLTRLGRGFPFLQDYYIGSLLVLTKYESDYYKGFVLVSDEDINDFLDVYGMSPTDTNSLINIERTTTQLDIDAFISSIIRSLTDGFPDTGWVSETTRRICQSANTVTTELVNTQPDNCLLLWLETEYTLFRRIENHCYQDIISNPFPSVDQFIHIANTILNRRKSRAGKSLEHHLNAIFNAHHLQFSHPGRTEGEKQPEFLFPGNTEYHSTDFDSESLIFLGAKTTCKDRWRQILSEAERIPVKHLFTLQQGISKNQLHEMYEESNVKLVVPRPYIGLYPREYQDRILNLSSFIEYVKEKQGF